MKEQDTDIKGETETQKANRSLWRWKKAGPFPHCLMVRVWRLTSIAESPNSGGDSLVLLKLR